MKTVTIIFAFVFGVLFTAATNGRGVGAFFGGLGAAIVTGLTMLIAWMLYTMAVELIIEPLRQIARRFWQSQQRRPIR